MAETPIATKIHQALDVHLHFTPHIAFHAIFGLEQLTNALDVRFSELLSELIFRDIRLLANLFRKRTTNTVKVWKGEGDVLVTGEVDACNTSHDAFLRAVTG